MLIHRKLITVLTTMSILLSAVALSEPEKGRPGRTKFPDTRIIGGEDAKPGEFPWIVALFEVIEGQQQQICGGSLIDKQWVLTAAHCVENAIDGFIVANFSIQVNLINVENPEEGHSSKVKKIFVNEAFNVASELDSDIALLELSEPAPDDIPVIPLADEAIMQASGAPGTLATIAGWGVSTDDGDTVPQLLKAEVPLVSTEICNAPESYNGDITETMFCAGFDEGGKDSCSGDSGGPLMIRHNDVLHQAGIVSWGEGCAEPKKYGVYARVASLINWVTDVQAGVIEGVGLLTLTSGSEGIVSGETGSEVTYEIEVPENANILFVDTRDGEGGAPGNVDLYARNGVPPTGDDCDQVSANPGNKEFILIEKPQAGTWFIQLRGVEAFENVEMTAFFR